MWDSAKKPIKVRSVLQPNGMRHFIVNDTVDEDVHDIKSLLHNNHQRRNSTTKPSTTRPSTINEVETGNDNNNGLTTETEDCKNNTSNTGASCTLPRSFTLNDASSSTDASWENNSGSGGGGGDFFGVSGSKIYNSKKHKGQHSRFLHQFPHSIKTNIEITRYPAAHLDLIPVKSPVIKKLINDRVDSSTASSHLKGSKGQSSATSTTLCSRIMTWIDLEVKRNASGGTKIKSSAGGTSSNTLSPSIPFSSADLSIVNDLYEYQSKLEGFLSSPPSPTDRSSSSSTASSTSGDGGSTNSASSCSSSTSSSVSLPKLIPCWRKDGSSNLTGCGGVGGNKAKKSVRIAEDLPRWGKMKRRLRRKTLSLNELYDDDEQPFFPSSTSSSSFHNNNRSVYSNKNGGSNKTDYFGGGGSGGSKLNDKSRKEYSSVSDLMEDRSCGNLPRVGEHQGASSCFRRCNDSPEKESDSFVVCDERLHTSGKVQVHIFLPQTDSAGGKHRNNSSGGGGGEGGESSAGNLSARSEDSTS